MLPVLRDWLICLSVFWLSSGATVEICFAYISYKGQCLTDIRPSNGCLQMRLDSGVISCFLVKVAWFPDGFICILSKKLSPGLHLLMDARWHLELKGICSLICPPTPDLRSWPFPGFVSFVTSRIPWDSFITIRESLPSHWFCCFGLCFSISSKEVEQVRKCSEHHTSFYGSQHILLHSSGQFCIENICGTLNQATGQDTHSPCYTTDSSTSCLVSNHSLLMHLGSSGWWLKHLSHYCPGERRREGAWLLALLCSSPMCCWHLGTEQVDRSLSLSLPSYPSAFEINI